MQHPILTDGRRRRLYFAAWAPIAPLLSVLLGGTSLNTLTDAAIVAFPMCAVYAMICLSAWYACQANPAGEVGVQRIIMTHLTAGLLASGVWLLAGEAWAGVLRVTGATNAADLFESQRNVLFICGVLLYSLSVTADYLIMAFESEKEAERQGLELKVLAREAELRALRAQIDPHFLFNSLNSIGALTIGDPAKARQMSLLLAEFFRKSLTYGSLDWIPLADEMSLADQFLSVEKVRFGSRLTIERRLEAGCNRCLVPPLLLQPLVENAIKHGIASSLDGGTILVETRRLHDRLMVAVENPVDSTVPARKGTGLGLQNVKDRLTALFGSESRFTVLDTDDRFRVELEFPCKALAVKASA